MSIPLRIVLLTGAILMTVFTISGIRKSRMSIMDGLFWAVFATIILVLGIFPQIGYAISGALGFISPVNFVFAFLIAVLIVKCFTMSSRQSNLESKTQELVQQIAVERLEHYERAHKTQSHGNTHESSLSAESPDEESARSVD